MKHRALFIAVLLAASSAVVQAQGQAPTTRELSFPGTPSYTGGMSPASTLRITETPSAPPPPITDSPQSRQEYSRCRTVSDRAAVNDEQMRAGAARCLQELEARRRQGR